MSKFWRKYHKWISIVVVVPFLITITTGILLLFRGDLNWISPKGEKTSGQLSIGFPEILKAAQSIPELKVESWDDVSRIQVSPAKGDIVVRSKNSDLQIQIDGGTGEVLSSGVLRSSLLVSLHEGTFWTKSYGRYVVGLPMALCVLFLTISGLVLFFQPMMFRRRAKAAATGAATRKDTNPARNGSRDYAEDESDLRGN